MNLRLRLPLPSIPAGLRVSKLPPGKKDPASLEPTVPGTPAQWTPAAFTAPDLLHQWFHQGAELGIGGENSQAAFSILADILKV
jgi:hypothetical protein